jgi:hypothetical protein
MLPTRLAEMVGSHVGMGTSHLIINENGETRGLL